MFEVKFFPHSGLEMLPDPFEDREDARDAVAATIRDYRASGGEVMLLDTGARWEFLEDEDASMVRDDAGVLRLKEVA